MESFEHLFEALTGNPPYPWQESLFELMAQGTQWNELRNISLPTGTGKTAIMAIWLLALASAAARAENCHGVLIPRRLIWVVNRRVVVDQATSEAQKIADRLNRQESLQKLRPVRDALANLSIGGSRDGVLAISTLRGQFADNASWRNDPSRPAIVVGTVDMIGSRLLFSGYGRGFKSRPLHAAYLGQDSILVHDEAHLEPAFQTLITTIQSEQNRCDEFRDFQFMALTATPRNGDSSFSLTERDLKDVNVRKVIEAKKWLVFDSAADEKRIAEDVHQEALKFKDSAQAILIFLRKLEDVKTVADKLHKAKLSVQTLTGTMRGLERDDLATSDRIFARFMREPSVEPRSGTVYLLCTSAGEVGINISGDQLICDLVPFDSMAQRFGRVNRFGGGEAKIRVIYAEDQDKDQQKKGTNARLLQASHQARLLLQKLPAREDHDRDASPAALSNLLSSLPAPERDAAFNPIPAILPATDILFDAWALTSIREKLPGRPPVANWLHGVSEWEPLQTYIAWRAEVEIVTPDLQGTYKPEDLLDDYPLKPQELLRDSTERILHGLKKMAERSSDLYTWLIADGKVRPLSLAELAAQDKDDLAECIVLLPPNAGGLDKGFFKGDELFDESHRDLYDVADKWLDENNAPRRCRVWDDAKRPGGMRLVRTIDVSTGTENELDDEDQAYARRYWRWYVLPKSADDDGSQTARTEQTLDPHLEAAGRFARSLVEKLVSEPEQASAVILAAKRHDLGKRRRLWQQSIGNRNSDVWLAKSGNGARPIQITGYRHEFGSLIEIFDDQEFRDLSPEVQELVLHLIAAHHGRARPHFPDSEAFDPDNSQQRAAEIAREVPGRYARLQRKYGRWGLAYLESLVRTADALASQAVDSAPESTWVASE